MVTCALSWPFIAYTQQYFLYALESALTCLVR